MKAAGAREFPNMQESSTQGQGLSPCEYEDASALNQFNSLQQQMPSAKRSFSAEGTVKRGSKFRTTMRNEFLNSTNKNGNFEEDPSQKKTTKVVLKRYNSAFPKDFFGNVKQQGGDSTQQCYQQQQLQGNNQTQGIIPTGYTYSIRQDSYQFLQQQQQQQQQQQFQQLQQQQQLYQQQQVLQNDQHTSNSAQKLTRQQMQILSQSQYLHQHMYPVAQNQKPIIPQQPQQPKGMYPMQQSMTSLHNSSNHGNQQNTSQQSYKYRCQSEADSPIKKSAYDILEGNNRIPQIIQSEQKLGYKNGLSYLQQQMLAQQPQQYQIQMANQSNHSQMQPSQNQLNSNNDSNNNNNKNINKNNNTQSSALINYNFSNSNNFPSSQMSGESSPLKEQKINNQMTFSNVNSSNQSLQFKPAFMSNAQPLNSSSSSALVVAAASQQQQQQQQPLQQQTQITHQHQQQLLNKLNSGNNFNLKNQIKTRQSIPPKQQFQHQNHVYCKTEANEEISVQQNPQQKANNTVNNHPSNMNFIDLLRGSINHDTPKFISEESTTQSSQLNIPNSFTAAIIQQQIMLKLKNEGQAQKPSHFQESKKNGDSDMFQSEKKPKKAIGQTEENSPTYEVQIKQKRKSKPVRSQSEIKLSNSVQSDLNATTNYNKVFKEETALAGIQPSKLTESQMQQNLKKESNKDSLHFATFSSQALAQIKKPEEKQIHQSPEENSKINLQRNIHSNSSQKRAQNNNSVAKSNEKSSQLIQKQASKKELSNSSSGEDKLNFNQSRQFFDLQFQVNTENQIQNNSNMQDRSVQNKDENGFENRQLLNKDYSCYQFNLQPLPVLPHKLVQSQNAFSSHQPNTRIHSPEDDRNGKENLINQINNIFNNLVNTNNIQNIQKSNYLNLLNAQQNSLIKKVSSNSSSNNNSVSNASASTALKNFDNHHSHSIKKLSNEESKVNQISERYSNEFIDDNLKNSVKSGKSSNNEIDEQNTSSNNNTKIFSRKTSNAKNEEQKSGQTSMHSSTKKSRIKVIYPAQLDANLFNQQGHHLRTQSEANLSTKKNSSPIKPFRCKDISDSKIEHSTENSEEFSPVHYNRLNTEADKESENIQSGSDFTRKVFSVCSFQQLEQNQQETEQKRRVRKPKSYHSQQVFNLSTSDTKKRINAVINQSSNNINNQDNTSSSNHISALESTSYQKEKQYDFSQQVQNSVTVPVQQKNITTTLPKINQNQNSYLQTRPTSIQKSRIRFNSMQKTKTETSPTNQDSSDAFTKINGFGSYSNSNKKIINAQQFSSNQKNNNQQMKLSDFISVKDKKTQNNTSNTESNERKQIDQHQPEEDSSQNQTSNTQTQNKINPFLSSNLNPNQFEFSFRNSICQKEAENQISQQINKHKIQNESQQRVGSSQASTHSNNSNNSNNQNNTQKAPSTASQQSQQMSSQMIYNIKLNLNVNQSQSKDASSSKLSSSQLKQPNKFFSEKKQLISQNLKTDYQ